MTYCRKLRNHERAQRAGLGAPQEAGADWLRPDGVSTNGVSAKVLFFEGLGKALSGHLLGNEVILNATKPMSKKQSAAERSRSARLPRAVRIARLRIARRATYLFVRLHIRVELTLQIITFVN